MNDKERDKNIYLLPLDLGLPLDSVSVTAIAITENRASCASCTLGLDQGAVTG